MKLVAVSLAVVFLPIIGSAQSASPDRAAFRIELESLKQTFYCAKDVSAGEITRGDVLADITKGDTRYVLIDNDTSGGGWAGPCGAGLELALVWLRIRGSTLLQLQSVKYYSCVHTIDGSRPLCSQGNCVVKYSQVKDCDERLIEMSFSAVFSYEAPEKGIQVTADPPVPVK